MANPFSKGWKYLMANFEHQIDQNADPRVQIQQAVAAAKKNHQEISQHAASIVGNRNQLEMKLERLIKQQEDLQNKARTALQAADKATSSGDADKAQQFNATAEVLASQLVAVEQELAQTREAHTAADQAAREAVAQQQQSEARLQEQLSQVSQLESQLNQAQMQEQTTRTMDSINQFGGDDSVPTLDGVRDKIERRYADALGAQEIAKNSMSDRMAEIETAGTDVAASSRLEEIRASMAGELESGSTKVVSQGAIETGDDAEAAQAGQAAQQGSPDQNATLSEAEAYLSGDSKPASSQEAGSEANDAEVVDAQPVADEDNRSDRDNR